MKMSTYEFQGCIYRTKFEMLDALVGQWLSEGGMNDRETMLGLLEDDSDQKLALKCVESWSLDAPRWEYSWMVKHMVNWEDMHAAFARLRINFDTIFPNKDVAV